MSEVNPLEISDVPEESICLPAGPNRTQNEDESFPDDSAAERFLVSDMRLSSGGGGGGVLPDNMSEPEETIEINRYELLEASFAEFIASQRLADSVTQFIQARIRRFLRDRYGLRGLKTDWLNTCMFELKNSIPGFGKLNVAGQGEHIYKRFLLSDMRLSSIGVLPDDTRGLYVADLPGPFILQVENIVASENRVGLTDGVLHVTGVVMDVSGLLMEDLAHPLKVRVRDVSVKKGILSPEVFEVLGDNPVVNTATMSKPEETINLNRYQLLADSDAEFIQLHIRSFLRDCYGLRGLSTKWLNTCICQLNELIPGFGKLSVPDQGKHIYKRFLLADMRLSSIGVLPYNIRTLYEADLPGPFILQVKDNIVASDKHVALTDGVRRVTGLLMEPFLAHEVEHLARGLKVCIRDVSVREGILLLVPEGFEVLGEKVEHLKVKRKVEEVEEANEPRSAKRMQFPADSPLAWKPNTVDGSANGVGDGATAGDSTLQVAISSIQEEKFAECSPSDNVVPDGVDNSETVTRDGKTPLVDTPLKDMLAYWAKKNDEPTWRTIQCGVHGLEIRFENREKYKCLVSVCDDSCAHAIVCLDSKIVEGQIGYYPYQVIRRSPEKMAALVAFQKNLHVFEGRMLIEMNKDSKFPFVCEIIGMKPLHEMPPCQPVTESKSMDRNRTSSPDLESHPEYFTALSEEWAKKIHLDNTFPDEETPPKYYLQVLTEEWAKKNHDDNTSMKCLIKCTVDTIKVWEYKDRTTYDCLVNVSDGSLTTIVRIADKTVQKHIGYSAKQVNEEYCASIHIAIMKFEDMLKYFKGTMYVEMKKDSDVLVASWINDEQNSFDMSWLQNAP